MQSNLNYNHILVLGGTSAIALALLNDLKPTNKVSLVGRSKQSLQEEADHFATKFGCTTQTAHADFTTKQGLLTIETILQNNQDIDLVIFAQGYMPPVGDSLGNIPDIYQVNLISVISVLQSITEELHGSTVDMLVLGSIAGTRGRASNYPYGSAKAAVTAFCEGYRLTELSPNHNLMLAQLGRVTSRMSNFHEGILTSSPQRVAKSLRRQLKTKKPTVYHPLWWYLVHCVLTVLPAKLLPK